MELPDELVGIEDELEIDDVPAPDLPGEGTDDGDGDEEDEVEREQFVVVAVGETEFAVHVNAVQRLVDVTEHTRVPRTSDAIDGITDLRGAITAVIDPRVLFDLPSSVEPSESEELVVFATGSGDGHAGIRVDEVLGVEAVPVTHVILDAEDVDDDEDLIRTTLDDPLIAGLIRLRGSDDEYEYRKILDADGVLDVAGEAAV